MDTIEPADELEGCSPNSDEAAGPVLRRIADELVRLAPSRTDPHAFHETKSDLVHELRRLALGLDQSLPRSIKLPRVGNVAPRNFATPSCADATRKLSAFLGLFRPAVTAFGGGRSRRGAIGCGCAGSICSNRRSVSDPSRPPTWLVFDQFRSTFSNSVAMIVEIAIPELTLIRMASASTGLMSFF